MILIGTICILGLWAFVLGIIQQAVGKEQKKTKFSLYVVATIIFVVLFVILIAKNT